MNSYGECAKALYNEGYNCSQAVVLAFADRLGLDKETIARLASSFGAGYGGMGEVCGAVSGMLIVLGLAKGFGNPSEKEKKKAQFAEISEMIAEFRQINGAIICREILKNVKSADEKKCTCGDKVKIAAEIVAKHI